MTTKWEKTGQTRAPLSKAIEYYMNPENSRNSAPKFVREIKILSREGDTVTWEQHSAIMGMRLRSVVKTSLNRASNTFETQAMSGSGKGTIMTRTLKSIPTGTEVRYTYDMHLPVLGFLVRGRGKKIFEHTVDEDMKALDSVP
jgi:hypothetical protein